jgi:predicted SprT family Zn-dependent metalloprotease
VRRYNVNRNAVWWVLYHACKAWGVPGLSACIEVYFADRIWNTNDRRPNALGVAKPIDLHIFLQRKHWKEDRRDRTDTLIHEAAHLVEYLRYGKCGHGKRHRSLMDQALEAVKKAGAFA